MYTPVMATLRSERLASGLRIPGCFALELDDGRNILFQNPSDFTSVAYHLGAPDIDPDYALGSDSMLKEHDKACKWLDSMVGEQFDIAHSYAELLEEEGLD